ncbi:Rho GTPase activating protein 24 [Balamuthia mandrillaris]
MSSPAGAAPPAAQGATTTTTTTTTDRKAAKKAEREKKKAEKAQKKAERKAQKKKGEGGAAPPSASQAPEEVDPLRYAVFGVPLAVAVQNSKDVGAREYLPLPVKLAIEYLDQKGLDEEGLYRIPGNLTTVKKYKEAMNRGEDINLMENELDPNNVSGLLIHFLKDMPESLFTEELKADFKRLCTYKDPTTKFQHLHHLWYQLPLINRQTIHYIVEHMHRIIQNTAKNKMNASNLSTSLGATWCAVLPVLLDAKINGQFPESTVVFGVPLADAARRSDPEGLVPAPIRVCINFIEKRGLTEPCIYQSAASRSFITKYRTLFDAGQEVVFEDHTDPLEVAGLVNVFFKEVPDSLWTEELKPEFIKLGEQKEGVNPEQLKELVNQLPMVNYETVRYLIWNLARIVEHKDKNKMSVESLAACWGPSWVKILPPLIRFYWEVFEGGVAEPNGQEGAEQEGVTEEEGGQSTVEEAGHPPTENED